MPSEDPDARLAWTAGAVARHLGVSVSTLRSWGRRYGLEPSRHTAGRHRRYDARDVARLEEMRELVASGVAPAAAARWAQADADSGTGQVAGREGSVAEPTRARGGLLEAALSLDGDTVTEVLVAHLAALGVVRTWDELCLPVLTELGERNALEPDCVDAEHLLSWSVAAALHRVPQPARVPGSRVALLACVEREWHSLGLDALRAALAERGATVRMLGASTPASALDTAVARSRPGAVVLWSQTAATAHAGVFAALNGARCTLVAAGRGWDGVRLPAEVARADGLLPALRLTLRALSG